MTKGWHIHQQFRPLACTPEICRSDAAKCPRQTGFVSPCELGWEESLAATRTQCILAPMYLIVYLFVINLCEYARSYMCYRYVALKLFRFQFTYILPRKIGSSCTKFVPPNILGTCDD